jgi:RpiB/LacA/LacB family sugar-phosphate isomerase
MDAARVYVGSDHAGFSLRKNLVERLRGQGREVVDLGPDSDSACDYPEFASAVANAVRSNPGSLGILVCATGQGMVIAAGKVRGIRAVAPATVEAARLTRFDNDANVLCLGSRLLSEPDAFDILDTWLATGFAGGRHARRIAKVTAIETASAMMFVTESEWLRLRALGLPERLFDRDAALLGDAPKGKAAGPEGLGWVFLPSEMTPRLPEIAKFAREVRRLPLKELVLLVDDAAQASAAIMTRACGSSAVHVHVVDASAHAAGAPVLPERLALGTAFVLVVAKAEDGTKLQACENEIWSKLLHRCGDDQERAGRHFAAVVAADHGFADIAKSHHYRGVFVDGPEPTPGAALLGHEGLVPAALLGHDPARLLERALAMAEACRASRLEDNPGASLGILLGALAKHGRNKLTLLLSKSFLPLGPWIARLFAVAAQRSSVEVVTLHGEPLQSSYPPDRVFVHVQTENEASAAAPEQMEALHGAGQPYIQIMVASRQDLAAEIYRWQMATTIASVVMGAKLAAPGTP